MNRLNLGGYPPNLSKTLHTISTTMMQCHMLWVKQQRSVVLLNHSQSTLYVILEKSTIGTIILFSEKVLISFYFKLDGVL